MNMTTGKKTLALALLSAGITVTLSAQSVDLGSAATQITQIASQAAGVIGGLIGLIGIGRCAYKFSNGDTGAVTALIEGIVGLVLGQIAAAMI